MKSWISLITLCFVFMSSSLALETLTLGVFAYRPKPVMEAAYQPLIDYLNQALPDVHFQLKVLTQDEIEGALEQGELDFVFTNPSHFVLLRSQTRLSGAIATQVRLEKNQHVSMLGGIIFTSQHHPEIQQLSDIKGRVLAIPGKKFLGGYQTQAFELLQANIRIPDDIAEVKHMGSHDAVVRAVLAGKADVGFVRTSIIESMSNEKEVDAADIRIINPKSYPGFPFLVSTALYPEWAFAAISGHVNERLERRVASALLQIEPESQVAKAAGIYGFTVPADYRPVDDLARALRLPPYEKGPAFTLGDTFSRWKWQILSSVFAIGLILLLAILLLISHRQLNRRQKLERMHLAALGEGVYGVALDGRCTFINPAALAMLGFTEQEVIGSNQHALFHHSRPNGQKYQVEECPIHLCLRDGVRRHTDEWFIRKDGTGFHVRLIVTVMELEGTKVGAEVAFEDITERKALEEKLTTMATIDVLTGLANRRHFFVRMGDELARVQRSKESVASILMLDLDHFKNINDTYGHAAGDAVLKSFSALLKNDLRETDLAGRIGGEEFAVTMPGATLDAAFARAERLRKVVEQEQLVHEGTTIHFRVSIGVTQMTLLDTSPDAVLARADEALYRAKEKRNCVSM